MSAWGRPGWRRTAWGGTRWRDQAGRRRQPKAMQVGEGDMGRRGQAGAAWAGRDSEGQVGVAWGGAVRPGRCGQIGAGMHGRPGRAARAGNRDERAWVAGAGSTRRRLGQATHAGGRGR